METEKVIFNCKKCNKELRFPKVERKIQFKCPHCSEFYEALNGSIIEENEHVAEVENEQEIVSETSSKEDIPLGKNQPNQDNEGEELAKKRNNNQKKSAAWKVLAIVALVILISENIFITYQKLTLDSNTEILDSFLNNLKNHRGNDFDAAKAYLTPAAKRKFEMFIEYPYKVKDSAGMNTVENFIHTLKVVNSVDNRRLLFINADYDSVFFHVDLITNGNKPLINFDSDVFLK